MSYRKEQQVTEQQKQFLASIQDSGIMPEVSKKELYDLFKSIMKDGFHGICFSMYEDGQEPGDSITEEQVRRRINILKPHVQWVRSFSCIEGNEFVPKVAKEEGMKTLVGAWISDDKEKNREELDALIKLANEGKVDIAAVGNEVLYRNDIPLEELKAHIEEVKRSIPSHIPVGYVDAYYEFAVHPDLTDLCDIILSNCYPFWEKCHHDYALTHMQQMYGQALQAGRGKKVIITETGWPSQGESLGAAEPSAENALKYFINTQLWCKKAGIESFYFSSFDESWKVGAEGVVGAYWGIWDKLEKLKY
ncbi:glycoside hydrolase family 17 protein [Psychroflexus sediminis]|uniref:Endo-1,3-beta-glucanase btgC n=1 Tax=Psychroflexus sediminis TaxID=470826 RepID=A0A1G7TSN0_9FLAO|nr:glycosyl hydrolase family 17 protein [Psychroflexus sediminis]SDG38313.1 Exo-beta-1,3-glucanase, GH17 family [Psychroflexus sediminis]